MKHILYDQNITNYDALLYTMMKCAMMHAIWLWYDGENLDEDVKAVNSEYDTNSEVHKQWHLESRLWNDERRHWNDETRP